MLTLVFYIYFLDGFRCILYIIPTLLNIQLKLSQVNFVQKLVFTVDFIKFERSTIKFHLSIRHHRVSIQFSTKLITFFYWWFEAKSIYLYQTFKCQEKISS